MENICELENIGKKYGNNVVLTNFSMTVRKGEMLAITGKSGAGKTTVLNIIGLLENPDSGLVRLFEQPSPRISSKNANKLLRTKLSYLFQNCALIDDADVNYNLEIPLIYARKSRKEKQDLKLAALKKVGLNIELKQKIYELSGGEQQKIAIARILLKPCNLILADEPTGSLDLKNRDEILEMLKELNHQGKTIIIVTHDPYVAETCSRKIELEYLKTDIRD